MSASARSVRRIPAGSPDFAALLRQIDGGVRQAEVARRLGISPAAVSAGLGRARRLDRLGLLGAGEAEVAAAAEFTGAPRSAVAALLGAAGRWSGPAADVPGSPRFMRGVRGGFDWKSVLRGPGEAIEAMRRSVAARKANRRAVPIRVGLAHAAAALGERESGRLDARGLARRLGVAGANAQEAMRYASVAGVVLACDLELGRRRTTAGGGRPPAALERDRALVAAVGAADATKDATALARELRTTRWRIAVARRALEVAPFILKAAEKMK